MLAGAAEVSPAGTLGRQVVPRLRNTGGDVRVLSRHGRGDEDGIRYLTGDLATGAVGRRTWEEFFAERVSPGTRSSGGHAGPSLKTSPQ